MLARNIAVYRRSYAVDILYNMSASTTQIVSDIYRPYALNYAL